MVQTGVVTGALRPAITNLSRIERTIDDVTLRLASGLQINSAIDNPQNFFAAQSLRNNASDLNRRVDELNQNILAVQQAGDGVEAILDNLQQAEALALDALEALRSGETIALVTGDVQLNTVSDVTALNGIAAGQTFDVIAGDGHGGTRTATFTIRAGQSGGALAAQLGNLRDANGRDLDLDAKLDANGNLQIRSTSGDFFRIEATAGTADEATLNALGLGAAADQFGNFTALPDNELRSQRLFRVDTGGVARITDRVRVGSITPIIEGEDGHAFNGIRGADIGNTDFYFIGVNGEALETFTFFGDSGQVGDRFSLEEFVNRINTNENLSPFLQASFDRDTGQIVINPTTQAPTSITFRIFEAGGNNLDTAFGFGNGALDQFAGIGGTTSADSFVFGSPPPEVTERLETDLANIRTSINQLAQDAQYRGTNLLLGEELVSILNASGSSRVTTSGENFTSDALGLGTVRLNSVPAIEETISILQSAIATTRSYGSTLATNLSILQTRSDFIRDSVNNLRGGADDLTLIDANEEGANLLAAQTQQALAVTALSLASQSQQSVLRLF